MSLPPLMTKKTGWRPLMPRRVDRPAAHRVGRCAAGRRGGHAAQQASVHRVEMGLNDVAGGERGDRRLERLERAVDGAELHIVHPEPVAVAGLAYRVTGGRHQAQGAVGVAGFHLVVQEGRDGVRPDFARGVLAGDGREDLLAARADGEGLGAGRGAAADLGEQVAARVVDAEALDLLGLGRFGAGAGEHLGRRDEEVSEDRALLVGEVDVVAAGADRRSGPPPPRPARRRRGAHHGW